MGESDFFSFGDEKLGSEGEDLWGGSSATISPSVGVALEPPGDHVEPVAASPNDDFEWDQIAGAHDEKGAERSRGDSYLGSSAKRKSPSRRAHSLVLLTLVAGVLAIAAVVLPSAGTDSQVASSAQLRPSVINKPVGADLVQGRHEHAEPTGSRASRAKAAEHQHVDRKKAQTRRRARRRRISRRGGRDGGQKRDSGQERDAQETSGAQVESPAAAPDIPVEVPTSAPEAPPAPPADEPASSEAGDPSVIHDGASSPEFGL